MKDIVSDYKDALQDAKDHNNSQNGSEEEAKDMVNGATDKFNEDLKDFMEDHFGGQELGEELIGGLTQGQENLNKENGGGGEEEKDNGSSSDKGENQEGDKQDGSQSDDTSGSGDQTEGSGDQTDGSGDQQTPGSGGEDPTKPGEDGKGETEQPPEGNSSEQTPGSGDGTQGDHFTDEKPEEDKNDEVFIPGIGFISMKALFDDETLNREFDKMFGRPITAEEREIIAAYLDFVKQDD